MAYDDMYKQDHQNHMYCTGASLLNLQLSITVCLLMAIWMCNGVEVMSSLTTVYESLSFIVGDVVETIWMCKADLVSQFGLVLVSTRALGLYVVLSSDAWGDLGCLHVHMVSSKVERWSLLHFVVEFTW